MLLALMLPALADCTVLVSTSELETTLLQAEAAFADLDVDGFVASMDKAAVSLPCLGVPIDSELSAHVHRDVGLRRYVDRDREAASAAFASARLLEPDFRFSDDLLPPGHEIRAVYSAQSLVGDTREAVPTPADGTVLLDGVAGAQRPLERPVILQLVDATGTPTQTSYLLPGEPLPTYPLARPDSDAVELPVDRLVQPRHVGLGSGAVAVAAGALYGVALAQKAQLASPQPDWTQDDLDSVVTRNHNLVITSGALTGVAALGGATSLVMWRL